MAGNVFINYRRGDEPAAAGRLFDHLERSFPPERLFLDVDSIPPGRDFVKELEIKVEACDVLLAVIGRNWLDARDAHGVLRLQDPRDFVHIEIASALRMDKRVIPVLVNDAQMPRTEDLPEPLRPLAHRNAVRLTHERFKSDAQGLVKAIEAAVEETKAEREAAEAATAARRAEQQTQIERERARLQVLSRADLVKAEELANWEFIKSGESIDDYRDHLARFPAGVTLRMARTRLEALVWQSLGPAPDTAALQAFLTEFPTGAHAEAARTRLELPEGTAETRHAAVALHDRPRGPQGASRRLVILGGAAVVAAAGVAATMLFNGSTKPAGTGDKPGKQVAADTLPGTATAPPKPAPTPQPLPDPTPPVQRSARAYKTAGPVAALAVVPDTDRALVATAAHGLQLWDSAAGRPLDSFGDPAKAVRAVTVAADGRTALSSNSDDVLSLWDISGAGRLKGSVRLIRSFRAWTGDAVLAVALTPDGSLALCGSSDATVEVWDTKTDRNVRRLVGQSDQITCVTCSADGRLAVAGSRDATIRLWDLATGTSRLELSGHRGPVRAAILSPDGRLVLSGGEDRTVAALGCIDGRCRAGLAWPFGRCFVPRVHAQRARLHLRQPGHDGARVGRAQWPPDQDLRRACGKDHRSRRAGAWRSGRRRERRRIAAGLASGRTLAASPLRGRRHLLSFH